MDSRRLKYKGYQPISVNMTLEVGNYFFENGSTVTLPLGSGLQDKTMLRFVKFDDITPIIVPNNSSTETIRINATDREDNTGIIFDIESEIILVWNATENRWEV